MKFSKVSLQEKIDQNEKEINTLKQTVENFKFKYYELNDNALKLFTSYTLEKEENTRLKEENEKMKEIIEGLVEECEGLLNIVPLKSTQGTFKDKISKVYNDSLLYYAISTLGTITKK